MSTPNLRQQQQTTLPTARPQAGIAERNEQRALEHAERERAAVDEPVVQADVQGRDEQLPADPLASLPGTVGSGASYRSI